MARGEVRKSRIKIEDLDTAAATDAKNHFGELLHRVVYSRIPVLVERHGQPVAVLVDIDHSVDYYQEWVKRRPHLVLKLFHAWEYSIIGFIYYHPILLAATVAHLGHVALDHYHHRPNPLTYFISRRTWLRFDARKIEPGKRIRQSYEDFPNKLPLGRLWEPWYRRKIEPWFAARLTIAPEDRVDESDR